MIRAIKVCSRVRELAYACGSIMTAAGDSNKDDYSRMVLWGLNRSSIIPSEVRYTTPKVRPLLQAT